MPSIVAMLAFCALAWMYGQDRPVYMMVLNFMGINPWWHPFIDSSYMYAMKECWERGVDIYKSVPCDADRIPVTRMAYSPLWPRLPFLPDVQSARVPVGVVTDWLWMASLSLLPPARNWREAALLAAAAASTMVCFALERNNIDVWMYLLAVAGVLLCMRGGLACWAGYAVFLLAGLLKYYPLVLFGLALRERPARFSAILGGCAAALAVFVAVFWRELAEALPNVPAGSPFADLFGISNIPLVLGSGARQGLGLSYHAGADVAFAARLVLTVLIARWALVLARQRGLREGLARLDGGARDWMAAGALVITGCYFMGQNMDYRGIYLMMALSGLVALWRVTAAPEVRVQVKWAALLVLPLMWDEAVQYWIILAMPDRLAGGFEVVLWLFREFAWVNLARMLLAVVLAFAMDTPVGRRLVTR